MLAGVLVGLVTLSTGILLLQARAADASAEDHHAEILHQVDRLVQLRGSETAITLGPHPDADLIARCQQALVDAGLPVSACSGVQPQGDQVLPHGIRVQHEQVVLQHLTPNQFGAWLTTWTTHPTGWRLVTLQLVHATDVLESSSDPSGHYTCFVDLAAPYLADRP